MTFAPGEALAHVRELPSVALEYARFLREVKVQGKVFEFLTMQLEAARIQEAKDTPVCQVVQRAEPSEKPSDLGVLTLAAVGVLAGLVLAVFAAVVIEGHHTDRGTGGPADNG